ncbi:transporter [Methylobacterium variabile]|uniref:transporter n=1 Tax=Methylobacterium variabile TaxID=298794 RepID=UPI000A91CF9C|nr:transporter [Methylobacterium variabile]
MGHRSCVRRRALAALLCACLAAAASPAFARSAALPGVTVGLPTGAQPPTGLYFNLTTSFGMRETLPRDSQANANQPTFVWATPWPGDKTQLRFVFTQPISAVSPQAREWEGGFGQQFIAAQLARDLGGGVGVSYMLGGYQTTGTRFAIQSPSLAHRFAISYTADGWNLTANLHYGMMLESRSPSGVLSNDYMNLDLTATKRFGQWQVGAIAFGSTDLPTGVASYRPQGQVAVGALVGYTFNPVTVQAFVTRDVAQRNYGGEETRFWMRVLVPLYRDQREALPNRTLVSRDEN